MTRMVLLIFSKTMKKNIDEITGTVIGGVTGWVTQPLYDDWIKPMLLTVICSIIGLLISHFGKKLLKKWKW